MPSEIARAGKAETTGRGARAVAFALTAGLVTGIASRLGDQLPAGLAWAVNLGGIWLALAFASGAVAFSARRGAAAGTLATASAAAGYYGVMRLAEGGANLAYLGSIGAFWLAIALVAGPVFGAAGGAWRSGDERHRVAAVALLAGSLIGEAVLVLSIRVDTLAHAPPLVAELTVGAALPVLLLEGRTQARRGLLLSAGFAVVAVAMLAALTVLLRAAT